MRSRYSGLSADTIALALSLTRPTRTAPMTEEEEKRVMQLSEREAWNAAIKAKKMAKLKAKEAKP